MKKQLSIFILALFSLSYSFAVTQKEALEARGYTEEDIKIIFKNGTYDIQKKTELENRYKLEMLGFSSVEIDKKLFRNIPKNALPVQLFTIKEKMYDTIIVSASEATSVPLGLIYAIIRVESNFNTLAISNKGAKGLMQLMPDTAVALSVHNSFDPTENIMGGAKYLKLLMTQFDGDIDLALASYNGGPGLVERNGRRVPDNEGIRVYIKEVKKFYKEYS
jgi:hypothetical protein